MIDDLKIESWFPTTIGICDYPYYMINKEKWVNHILSKPTRHGFGGDDYMPHQDNKIFGELNKRGKEIDFLVLSQNTGKNAIQSLI